MLPFLFSLGVFCFLYDLFLLCFSSFFLLSNTSCFLFERFPKNLIISSMNNWHIGSLGLWTLDSRRWTLDAGRWTLDVGRYTLDAGLWALVTIVDCFRTKAEASFWFCLIKLLKILWVPISNDLMVTLVL